LNTEVKKEIMDQENKSELHPVKLDFVYVAILKMKNKSIDASVFIGLFLAATISALIWVLIKYPMDNLFGVVPFVVGILLFTWLFLFNILRFFKYRNIRESEIYKAIFLEPGKITKIKTVYYYPETPAPTGSNSHAFFYSGNKKIDMLTLSPDNLGRLIEYLKSNNKDLICERFQRGKN
jgi:hypothetical protein